MEEDRGAGYWLLVAGWLLLVLPALCLAAYLAAPPKWRSAVGLPETAAAAAAPPAAVSGRLPPLSEALHEGGQEARGEPAWRRHRQPPPAVAATTPLIALVLTGLGRDGTLLTDALALPGGVTLSFSPYGRPFDVAMAAAGEAGHELLLDLPMEGGAASDLGPQALLTLLDLDRNLQRLAWLLQGPEGGELPPVVGVVALGGDPFLAAPDLAGPVLQALAAEGLILLDPQGAGRVPPTAGLPLLAADKQLSASPPEDPGATEGGAAEGSGTLQRQLAELERGALLNGSAIVVVPAEAALLDALGPWLATLRQRGYALAPLSAVLERRLSTAAR